MLDLTQVYQFRNVLDQKRERRTSQLNRRQVKFDRSTKDGKEAKRTRDKGRRATKADIAFGRKVHVIFG